jgi:hypothetical protein
VYRAVRPHGDTTTAPAAVTNAGTVTLAGQALGDYQIRLFANGGYVVLDEIGIKVQ